MFKRWGVLSVAFAAVLAIAAMGISGRATERKLENAKRKHANTHAKALTLSQHSQEESGRDDGAALEKYENRAYPGAYVDPAHTRAAAAAFDVLGKRAGHKRASWQALGPTTPTVPAEVTYTGVKTTDSGRITAMALAPSCGGDDDCTLLVATAGGGVWAGEDALSRNVEWRSTNAGIPTNAIGSLIFDPTDRRGKTVYAGTGEGNQSADSEAGTGLYRSTDRGRSWSLVAGSAPVAANAAIDAIAVDPMNSRHLLIGTNDAVGHGTGVSGGYSFPIPGAPAAGLYESNDGGATFAATLPLPVAQIAIDPRDPATVYVATFGFGLYRRSPRLDGDSEFHLVRDSSGLGFDRAAFALTVKNGHTRIYEARAAGDTEDDFARTDNADVPAAQLLASGWILLSNPDPLSPGYSSWNFSAGQGWYDISLGTPPGKPDEVWLGGSMQYGEIFTPTPPSNGRAVQRSVDAGASFTDMTNDANNLGTHPDQHAIAFAGRITFIGDDGGVMRTSGSYVNASSQCDSRGLDAVGLAQCHAWLSSIPTRLDSLNVGLNTLQFNSFSINHQNPTEIMGGTQDNGTWAFDGKSWFESVGGDGGQSGIDATNPNLRMHTYTGGQCDVTFTGTDTLGWDYVGHPLTRSREAFSFYMPLINDPAVSGTWFAGGQHVFRTQDNGGDKAYLDLHCNEFFGDFAAGVTCGDWEKMGGPTLTGLAFGTDKRTDTGNYVVSIARTATTANTLWAATRRGRVFITKNAAVQPASSVEFVRVDTSAQPNRFVSGISVDAADGNHAFVAFSGYSARTPTTPGHVYEASYHDASGTATWKDISYDIGDLPVTGLARDDLNGDLFAASEFGVVVLHNGATHWVPAAAGLPPAAVYNLDIDSAGRVLYAATHGRGAWKLDLSERDDDSRIAQR